MRESQSYYKHCVCWLLSTTYVKSWHFQIQTFKNILISPLSLSLWKQIIIRIKIKWHNTNKTRISKFLLLMFINKYHFI